MPYVLPPDRNIGRSIERYTIQSLLGRGGMGAAYLAQHALFPEMRRVVKLILGDLRDNPAMLARWWNEAKAVARIRHDNVVRLEDFGTLEDGQPFMLFEYIEGRSFHQHVADHQGRLPLRAALDIFVQLCDALDTAHGLGIVHRDLKPDNVMIEVNAPGARPVRAKVLDFGIAKVGALVSERTPVGTVMGTPGFMAPEQSRDSAAVTGKADVFAIATLLYLAVVGDMPWGSAGSAISICLRQHTEPPNEPPPSLMPPAVRNLVFRALSVQPEARPTMREFACELAAAVPAEHPLPGGVEILREIKPGWASTPVPALSASSPFLVLTSTPVPTLVSTSVPTLASTRPTLRPDVAPPCDARISPSGGFAAASRPLSLVAGLPTGLFTPVPFVASAPPRDACARFLVVTSGSLASARASSEEASSEIVASEIVASEIVASEIDPSVAHPASATDADCLPSIIVSGSLLIAAPEPRAEPLPMIVLPHPAPGRSSWATRRSPWPTRIGVALVVIAIAAVWAHWASLL